MFFGNFFHNNYRNTRANIFTLTSGVYAAIFTDLWFILKLGPHDVWYMFAMRVV